MTLDENDFKSFFSRAAGKLAPSAVAARVRMGRPVLDIKYRQVGSSPEVPSERKAACNLKAVFLRALVGAPPGSVLIPTKSRRSKDAQGRIFVTLILIDQEEGIPITVECGVGCDREATDIEGIDDVLRELYKEGLIDSLTDIKNTSVTPAGRDFLRQSNI